MIFSISWTTTILSLVTKVILLTSSNGTGLHFVSAFQTPIFEKSVSKTAPSKSEGVEIQLPNFDELFGRIQKVSPLAKLVIEQCGSGPGGGFAKIDDNHEPSMKWKKVESNKRKIVHQIEKIDNFQDLGCPIIRMRSSLQGQCIPKLFADIITTLEGRKNWDPQIAGVQEIYPIYDTDMANLAMGVGKYGDCCRLGVGYVQLKSNIGVDPREQLTIAGVQEFENGSALLWATEMEEWNNHLFPPGPRCTRAKTHLFSVALVPTGQDSFDVEYILQFELGGKMPTFFSTPLLIETLKNMFVYAKSCFEDENVFNSYLEEQKKNPLEDRHSILMTP